MVRVARPGGRIVLCDAVASDDPAKAAAFNAMERFRDPSTVEFRPLALSARAVCAAGLPEPEVRFYQVPVERERLIAMSFPAGDDRAGLRAMLDAAVEGDAMGVGARRDGDTMRFEYPAAVVLGSSGYCAARYPGPSGGDHARRPRPWVPALGLTPSAGMTRAAAPSSWVAGSRAFGAAPQRDACTG